MLDTSQLRALMISQATAALVRAGEHALGRAKHHAPVRALFKRDRRGEAFPTSFRTIRSERRMQAFRRSKERRRRVDVGESDQVGLADEMLREQAGGITRKSGRRTGATNFTGHANSFFPVLRQGRFKMTADLRRFDPVGQTMAFGRGISQGPGRLNPDYDPRLSLDDPASKERRQGLSPREVQSRSQLYLRGQVNTVPARNVMRAARKAFSARGRYEVHRARLGGANSALHKGRIGGRLRDEIHLTQPERRSGSIWVYVVSPTPYAEYQEFGTSHNRASPYLRPALYESRNVLRSEVRAAMADIQSRGSKAGRAFAELDAPAGSRDEGR